jgi:hypothetical protein
VFISFVLLKGDGVAHFPGYIFGIPVDSETKTLVPTAVETRPAGFVVPYSLSFLDNDDTRAVVSDAALGAHFITIAYPSLDVTLDNTLMISLNSAPCWTAYAPDLELVYVMGGFDPKPVAVDTNKQTVRYQIDAPASTLGGFDSLVWKDWLYVLQGASGISVFQIDADGGKLIQNLDLSALGNREGWDGLAFYGK